VLKGAFKMTTIREAKQLTAWPVSALAGLAMSGSAGFALLLLALHFLRPDLNPIAQPGSAYALGAFGWLMTLAFFSFGLGGWALVLALARGAPSGAHSRAGLALVAAWATSILLAGLFPMDPLGSTPTPSGAIHDLSGFLGFLCWIVGAFLVARRLWASDRSNRAWQALLALSVLMPAGYAGTALSFATRQPFTGLVQRLFLATIIVWIILAANSLRARTGEARVP
jgi:hypothetical protein